MPKNSRRRKTNGVAQSQKPDKLTVQYGWRMVSLSQTTNICNFSPDKFWGLIFLHIKNVHQNVQFLHPIWTFPTLSSVSGTNINAFNVKTSFGVKRSGAISCLFPLSLSLFYVWKALLLQLCWSIPGNCIVFVFVIVFVIELSDCMQLQWWWLMLSFKCWTALNSFSPYYPLHSNAAKCI